MKKLLFAAFAFFAAACSESDKNDTAPNVFADTAWELVKEEGYEVSGEFRDEWNAKPDDFDAVYFFGKDRTGTYTTCEYFDGNAESSISEIRWEYSAAAETLAIGFVESGDRKTYKVKSLDEALATLVLEIHEVQPENGYEYRNVETYVRR